MLRSRFSSFLLLFLLLYSPIIARNNWDTYSDTWVAVDGLGRKIPTSDDGLSTLKEHKTIGMFYFIWFGPHGTDGHPIHDITEMLKEPDHITLGDKGEMHWWGKPVMNYYVNGDGYVYDRHLQMLADAGVDFLFLDVTNAYTYDDAVQSLMDAIDRREKNGGKTPNYALCFILMKKKHWSMSIMNFIKIQPMISIGFISMESRYYWPIRMTLHGCVQLGIRQW